MPISHSASASYSAVFREGARIGDYRIVREIGEGGMASVWLARHIPLDRLVALKILRPEFSADDRHLRRFMREARSAAQLDSPAIVRIYEVGTFGGGGNSFQAETSFDGKTGKKTGFCLRCVRTLIQPWFCRRQRQIRYIAEEYISGMNLGVYVHRHGPLSLHQTLAVIRQVAEALQTAADAGVVHRDIKPENILLSDTGKVKVVDFGLAFYLEENNISELSLTRAGITIGTPLYMSPEQAEGGEVDIRSDIYSLGAAAFWMLTGRPPFTGGTPMSVLLRHINAEPPVPSELRPEIPPAVSDLLLRMMAKKKENRFANPALLREEIDHLQKEILSDDTHFFCSDEDQESFSSDFFAEKGAKLAFTQELNRQETTRLLQNSLTEMISLKESSGVGGIRKSLLRTGTALALSFLLGIGGALIFRYSAFHSDGHSLIQQLGSVEEQWVLASQLGTSDAWRSVIQFFPHEKVWIDNARQKLASSLMEEEKIDEAEKIFNELASGRGANPADIPFGMAGTAWVFAVKGDVGQSASILSQLRKDGHVYDRQTEELISRTGEQIRKTDGDTGNE